MASNDRLVLTGTLLALFMTACKQKCRDEWESLRSSKSAEIELARSEAFSECVLDRGLMPEYTVMNPKTGAVLSDDELAVRHGPVRVQMEVVFRWRRERFVWTARSPESVWPLFRE